MARYKLGIFNKKEGRVINLDSIIKLKDLISLDQFTVAFNNESELKIYLFNQGLITNEELKQNISLMYRYDGKVKKLQIAYKEMEKYLDIEYLRYELKGLSSNIEFLEKLANYYSNGSTKFNKQGVNVEDIRRYLSDVRINGGQTFHSTMLEAAIDDLFEKAIIREKNVQTGEVKEDYRGQRDLAMLIYKYKKGLEKKQEEQTKTNNESSWVQPSVFDTKSEEQIQSINYDSEEENANGKWILSSEGEPIFPPNSEEEANYLRYLEELENNIEEKHHYRR